ncbi:hypothetical protein WAI453_003596 [Rhynchosporium graminicola]
MVLYSPEPKNRPVGTVRLVPSPHHPHPVEGARYEAPDEDGLAFTARELFLAPLPKYTNDRSTSLHDGVKPFVKLGRLCVMEKCRGRQCAVWLVQRMLQWAVASPGFACAGDGRQWKGLVGIHANVDAIRTWKKCGFEVDEAMGEWGNGSKAECDLAGCF